MPCRVVAYFGTDNRQLSVLGLSAANRFYLKLVRCRQDLARIVENFHIRFTMHAAMRHYSSLSSDRSELAAKDSCSTCVCMQFGRCGTCCTSASLQPHSSSRSASHFRERVPLRNDHRSACNCHYPQFCASCSVPNAGLVPAPSAGQCNAHQFRSSGRMQ